MQPYFAKDMEKIRTETERRAYIAHAIELVACFFMRGTDHLPLVPDIGNYLFGGSSSDQAITLGGVTPDGKDGVNDMTYIILKVTEMLSIRDPNVNARFSLEKNSDTYLKRLCEVNYITVATPSMHSDENIAASLAPHGYAIEDVRDWAATGCVEPTLCGRHMGHTGSILMNMVAALEMALNNGRHPSMDWDLGPSTGSIEKGGFTTFEEFFSAYTAQQKFLIDQAVELNNLLAEAHTVLRPTPLLSTLIDGSIEKGTDVTKGGARYNTSGSSNIGLADVTDSLMAIKKLVFDDKIISFTELKRGSRCEFYRLSENPRAGAKQGPALRIGKQRIARACRQDN
ncbi:MAG: pyruvate formate lyase family protein [Desulfobacterales bacterium]|nr:pyruvate formate lyase family protein [Desulfobacterales bacterium]